MHTSIFNKSLRVAYYARVSTQFESQISSLENQKNHYETMIKNNTNWTFFAGYIDEGITGTSALKRENFLKMISDAKNGLFDLIITKEISRFSRNTLESITYTRELLKCGVGVYFESDGICTLSSDSELRLTIMSAIYQDEVRRISERIKFGFKEAIDSQKVLGTGNLIGYTKKDGVLMLDEKGAEVVRRIFHLYADKCLGIRQISKVLEMEGKLNSNGNPYTFSCIKNIITNPKYKGFYCGRKYENTDFICGKKTKIDKEKWVLKKDENIPQIVSEDVWERANKILKERGNKGVCTSTKYDFSGKIFCNIDEKTYHRVVISGKEAWQCSDKRTKNCQGSTLYTSEVATALLGILKSEIDANRVCDDLCEIYAKCNVKKDDEKNEKVKSLIKNKEYLLLLLNDRIINDEEFEIKKNEIDKKINKIKTAKANTIDKKIIENGIKSIFQNDYQKLIAQITDKIYVKNTAKFNMELNVHLKNGKKYEVRYIKKGSKVLSEPEVNTIK